MIYKYRIKVVLISYLGYIFFSVSQIIVIYQTFLYYLTKIRLMIISYSNIIVIII